MTTHRKCASIIGVVHVLRDTCSLKHTMHNANIHHDILGTLILMYIESWRRRVMSHVAALPSVATLASFWMQGATSKTWHLMLLQNLEWVPYGAKYLLDRFRPCRHSSPSRHAHNNKNIRETMWWTWNANDAKATKPNDNVCARIQSKTLSRRIVCSAPKIVSIIRQLAIACVRGYRCLRDAGAHSLSPNANTHTHTHTSEHFTKGEDTITTTTDDTEWTRRSTHTLRLK